MVWFAKFRTKNIDDINIRRAFKRLKPVLGCMPHNSIGITDSILSTVSICKKEDIEKLFQIFVEVGYMEEDYVKTNSGVQFKLYKATDEGRRILKI